MRPVRDVVLATAPTGGTEALLPFPPTHPATHGLLRIAARLDDDDRVVTAEVRPGFMHRGAEKLMEVRDHRAAMALANRHDWLAPVVGELTVALAAERLLGIAVPERATWLRTLLVEVTRITAGAVFLAADAAVPAPLAGRLRAAREDLLHHVEALTGARMHVTFARVGGVAAAPPDGWCASLLRSLDAQLPALTAAAAHAAASGHGAGVAVVSRDAALGHGASGPVGRASGVDVDLRRADPALAYHQLAPLLTAELGSDGDVRARRRCLAADLVVAAGLAAECARRVEALDGPFAQPLPKVLRLPVGAAWAWLDGPFGVAGVYLESRGDAVPHRVKLRTPGFAHASLLGPALTGTLLADVPDAVASFLLVCGDIDR